MTGYKNEFDVWFEQELIRSKKYKPETFTCPKIYGWWDKFDLPTYLQALQIVKLAQELAKETPYKKSQIKESYLFKGGYHSTANTLTERPLEQKLMGKLDSWEVLICRHFHKGADTAHQVFIAGYSDIVYAYIPAFIGEVLSQKINYSDIKPIKSSW